MDHSCSMFYCCTNYFSDVKSHLLKLKIGINQNPHKRIPKKQNISAFQQQLTALDPPMLKNHPSNGPSVFMQSNSPCQLCECNFIQRSQVSLMVSVKKI